MLNIQLPQIIHDLKLKEFPANWYGKANRKLINLFFLYIKKSDPLVETIIGKFCIKMPFSHELPFIIKQAPYYSTNLGRIAKMVQEKYEDLKLIDIGANVGDSVALLRSISYFPILCIEGSDYYFSILQTNATQFTDVYLSKNYLGDADMNSSLMPVEFGGTAYLDRFESDGNKIRIKTLENVLKEHPLFEETKMIKLDTDGFDNKILKGSIDFLNDAKPVLFFEYDPHCLAKQNDDGLSIFSDLSDIGYQNMLIYDNYGELLLSSTLDNTRLIEDVTHFYTGRNSSRYCDICAFHSNDNDLFDKIRKSEMDFFIRSRISA